MTFARDSIQFQILERLCATPKAVRGISTVMLNQAFNAPRAIDDLAAAGLIRKRGWDKGPGALWVPTPAGEELYARYRAE